MIKDQVECIKQSVKYVRVIEITLTAGRERKDIGMRPEGHFPLEFK